MLLSLHLNIRIFVIKILNNIFVKFVLNYYEKVFVNNNNIFKQNFSFIF